MMEGFGRSQSALTPEEELKRAKRLVKTARTRARNSSQQTLSDRDKKELVERQKRIENEKAFQKWAKKKSSQLLLTTKESNSTTSSSSTRKKSLSPLPMQTRQSKKTQGRRRSNSFDSPKGILRSSQSVADLGQRKQKSFRFSSDLTSTSMVSLHPATNKSPRMGRRSKSTSPLCSPRASTSISPLQSPQISPRPSTSGRVSPRRRSTMVVVGADEDGEYELVFDDEGKEPRNKILHQHVCKSTLSLPSLYRAKSMDTALDELDDEEEFIDPAEAVMKRLSKLEVKRSRSKLLHPSRLIDRSHDLRGSREDLAAILSSDSDE